MLDFNLYLPTRVVFGKGAEAQVGELVKQSSGRRVLLHYGGGSVVRSGLLDRVKSSLDAAGVAYAELGGVVPNPHLGKAREGIELGRGFGADFILAVGGGSVIDSAKCIAYGLAEPELDVWDLYIGKRQPKACLPVGCVLTIAAAGSEMSMGSVITNELTHEKRSVDNDLARPIFSVLNPELTETLPDYQTASGCTDIIMHVMERYFQQAGNMDITDALSEAIMRTVMHYAAVLHSDPKNYEARAEVMWAGSLAHNGITGCGTDGGDWATHMLEHELGGMFDVTHGAGLAAVWGSWARRVYRQCLPRFVKYALNVMEVEIGSSDEETALRGIEATEDFFRSIDMPTNLRELGIEPTDEQIAALAESCARAGGGSIGSAVELKKEDMIAIYRAAR